MPIQTATHAEAEAGAATVRDPARRRILQVFLGGGILASVVSFLYPVSRYLVPPEKVDLGANSVLAGKVDELKPNSFKIFRFGSRPGILIRTVDGQYRALSATCTHLGCTVQYKADAHRIWCACHNGMYDLNGKNISGPPPRPLQLYAVHIKGDEIYVSRNEES